MPTPPRRRRCQFSIASLFWLTLIVALAVFGIREHQQRVVLDAEVEGLHSRLSDALEQFDLADTPSQKALISKQSGRLQLQILEMQEQINALRDATAEYERKNKAGRIEPASPDASETKP